MTVNSFELTSIAALSAIVAMNFTRAVFTVHIQLLVKKMSGLRRYGPRIFGREIEMQCEPHSEV
ncbi:hypothetical protein [Undibacterium sp. Ji22W]|uniref:hypothetical protein n=1 Tax=Undibacterium sp. Ji22W TaxID=3413038 RepID=UPI003BF41E68